MGRTRSPWAFVVVGSLELLEEGLGHQVSILFTKPLLMPLLAWWYVGRVAGAWSASHRAMMLVFLMSWVGDVALMLAPSGPADRFVLGLPKHEAWFLVGVAAFFVAHLALIRVFLRVDRPEIAGPWPRRAWWFLPPVVWGLAVGMVVVGAIAGDPDRGAAAVPVALYGSLLVTMVCTAINRQGRVDGSSFQITVAGAALFLLSDSLIGLTMLVPGGDLPLAGVWIMSTYLAAEALMAEGVLRQAERPARG